MPRRSGLVRPALLAAALGLTSLILVRCAPRPAPAPAPPVAVRAALDLEPLDLSPDGELRLLVRLRYTAADGRRAHIPPGGHVDVSASRGTVQWQPRVRFGDPAAIVRLSEAGPLRIRVDSDIPHLPRVLGALTDTRAWRLPAVTARALGPHAVVIGWFPRVRTGGVRIARIAAHGRRVDFAPVPAPASTFRDTSVAPRAQYTYIVRRPGADPVELGVGVPPELPRSTLAVMRGKAMWLSFDDDVRGWNVGAMLARAQRAGLRAIELRLCYGEYDEVTPARRPAIDAFIDGAARRGIAIVAWTVPRALTFEDLAATLRAAAYRTAAGNGPRGLAVDLERGPEFLGGGRAAQAALSTYVGRLREAVGPRVLLVATVEDAAIEQLTNSDVPYAAIARAADALQPMVYWRARRAGASIAGMRATLRDSVARTRSLAGRAVPLDIGGQTAALGNRWGAPPPDEIAASIVEAARLGAVGVAFFDWDGTSAGQWSALGATDFAR